MAKARKSKISTKVRLAGVHHAGQRREALHPMIAQADIPAAQRARSIYEVAAVPNPHGEFIQNGEIKRHKVVRRVPHFETLYRSRVIDRAVFDVLQWYDDRLGIAEGGMFKCGLDTSGGGGSALHHTPTTMLAMEARSEVAWARGFIPADLLPAFDAVMQDGETFIDTARRLCAARYVRVSVERARKVLRDQFLAAAIALHDGVASRVCAGARVCA